MVRCCVGIGVRHMASDGQAGCLDSSHLEIRVGLPTSKAVVPGNKVPGGSQLTYKSDEPKMRVAFGGLYHVLV